MENLFDTSTEYEDINDYHRAGEGCSCPRCGEPLYNESGELYCPCCGFQEG